MDKEKNTTYSYRDSGNVPHTVDLSKADFELTQADASIHDVKFKTKPTTFFKDALKRFSKNKSSVAGAIILGILLVFSFVLPLAIQNDTTTNHPEAQFLEPKLFNAGTGWWDGTKRYNNVVCSNNEVTAETNADSNYKNTEGYKYPSGYGFRSIMNLTEPVKSLVNSPDENVTGGQLKIVNSNEYHAEEVDQSAFYGVYTSGAISLDSSFTYNISATFSPSDDTESVDGEFAFVIVHDNGEDILTDFQTINEEKTISFDLGTVVSEKGYDFTNYANNAKVGFLLKNNTTQNSSLFINSFTISSTDATENIKNILKNVSFKDGNEVLLRKATIQQLNSETGKYEDIANPGFFQNSKCFTSLYKGEAYTCSFTLDSYENALGVKDNISVGLSEFAGYAGYTVNELTGEVELDENSDVYKNRSCNLDLSDSMLQEGKEAKLMASFQTKKDDDSIKKDNCPVINIVSVSIDNNPVVGSKVVTFKCKVYYYRYKGYGDNMPTFILGTDKYGKDMLKITFSGLRTSLLLGFLTFAVCFTFGLILGSIEGYYGGRIDIVLQRLTEILSGVPWIVVMTLVVLFLGSNFWSFALALCLTGWIGTSNLARTQFYRFKGREYILASRTLGARDGRLIFKHILPNAMGTIITSSVLMIPSVIFSEATISYLGLGLKNTDSLGVILSDNQPNLSTHPYTLILPAVIIALIMISFNLFGNGLRDAFNPSLKGSDE